MTCRSALAREGDLAATHSWPGSPRSPASRLLQILRAPKARGVARIAGFCVRERSPVPPGLTDLCVRRRRSVAPDRWILRTPNVAGVAPITCSSALAREGDLAATHSWPGSPSSPASRLLQILRTPKVGGVSRILHVPNDAGVHQSPVGARLPAKAILLQRIRGLFTAFASKSAPTDLHTHQRLGNVCWACAWEARP